MLMTIIETLLTTSAAGISIGFILKIFLETGIKEALSQVYKKDLENYKFYLKNSEKVFEFKLNASKEMYKLSRDIKPEKSHPDMDWHEACEQIAYDFSAYEKKLNNFMCEYHATLSEDIYERIHKAISACAIGNSGVTIASTDQPPICNETATQKASELFDALQEAVDMLRKEVQDMIVFKKPNKTN